MTRPMSRTTTGTKSKLLLLALGYAALLAYGTLYPFADWSTPDYNITERMLSEGLSGSRTDILVNFLVYLPFGLLFFKGLPADSNSKAAEWYSGLISATGTSM